MVNHNNWISPCQIIIISGAIIEAALVMQLQFSSLSKEVIFLLWLMLPFILLIFLNWISPNNKQICLSFSSIFVLCSISYIVNIMFFALDAQGGISILFIPIIQYLAISLIFLFFHIKKP